MTEETFDVVEKTIEPVLVAGFRMRGRYADCGKGFGKLGRHYGRHAAGKPFLLIHDAEYKPDDADFEPCFPLRQGAKLKHPAPEGVSVRELPGGTCLTLMHLGPYDQLSTAYDRLFAHAEQRGLQITPPSREVYHKGPGLIFRGNPKKYLTEIQLFC